MYIKEEGVRYIILTKMTSQGKRHGKSRRTVRF